MKTKKKKFFPQFYPGKKKFLTCERLKKKKNKLLYKNDYKNKTPEKTK